MTADNSGLPKFEDLLAAASADNPDSDAAFGLARAYANGTGTQRDESEALRWYERAADMGHAQAACIAGSMYEDGLGAPRDLIRALAWYKIGSDRGSALAPNNIGALYCNGQGVPENHREAVRWFQRGADMGEPTAMANLGTIYLCGQGIAMDEHAAAGWFRRSAEAGCDSGRFGLAIMTELGLATEEDAQEAAVWYRKIIELGGAEAKRKAGWLWYNVGLQQVKAGRYDKSIASTTRALDLAPDHANSHYSIACAYCLQGNVELALKHVAEALRCDPHLAEAIAADCDFKSIQGNFRFRKLLRASRPEAGKAQGGVS